MNISHTASSLYDAYDVNITDFIEGMNVIRKNEFPGIEIFAPADNVYKFSAIIPVISGTVIFHVALQHHHLHFTIFLVSPCYCSSCSALPVYVDSLMPHSPFRQTFELGIFISTAGSRVLNLVKWGEYSPVKFANIVYFYIMRGNV